MGAQFNTALKTHRAGLSVHHKDLTPTIGGQSDSAPLRLHSWRGAVLFLGAAMSTYYSPGCTNEKAHICNNCEEDDGRPTLYWQASDFDLCHQCLLNLTTYHVDPQLKNHEAITVRRMAIPESLRNEIFERDGNKCTVCGSDNHLQVDHVVPFSRGGKTTKDNMQTLCKSCNLTKRAR